MINTLYAILTEQDGKESIYAISYGEALMMQAVSSIKSLMENRLKDAKEKFPDRKFQLVKFIRAET